MNCYVIGPKKKFAMCHAQLEKDSQLSYLGFYELPKVTPKSLISLLCIEFIFIYDGTVKCQCS